MGGLGGMKGRENDKFILNSKYFKKEYVITMICGPTDNEGSGRQRGKTIFAELLPTNKQQQQRNFFIA